MAEPAVSLVNTLTTKRILPGVVDNFFKSGPVMGYLRQNRLVPWTGSDTIQENFLYGPFKAGARAKGSKFDITKRRNLAAATFNPKYYYTSVTEYLEDIEVELKGPTAVISLVKTDMATAAMSLSAKLEIAFWHGGQSTRILELNGAEEGLNDGSTAGWAGNTFATYGGETRANINDALDSPMTAASGQAASVSGPITYGTMEHAYNSVCFGSEEPQSIVTTKLCYGYISTNFHPQRVIETRDPVLGFNGIKFKNAVIVKSDYAPGTAGVNDTDLGNYYASAGEVMAFLNYGPASVDDSFIRLHVSTSPKFSFGFTGFKGEIDSNTVAGQIQFAGNITFRAPRLSRILHAITG